MALTPPLFLPQKVIVHTSYRSSAGYFDLNREAREWLKEHDIAYALRANPSGGEPVIFFEKPEDAFAFKIRWF